MFEKQMIERRTLNLKCLGLARVAAIAENEIERLAAVGDVKLRAGLLDQTGLLQGWENAKFLEDGAVVRQERFADVKTRETFLLEDQHPSPGAGEKCRSGRASGTATDYQDVVN